MSTTLITPAFPAPVLQPFPLPTATGAGFSTIQVPNTTILSIYPVSPKPKSMHHGQSGFTYYLPAAQKDLIITRTCNPAYQMGMWQSAQHPFAYEDSVQPSSADRGYVLLHIYDAQTMIRNFLGDSLELVPRIVPSIGIAQALLNHWLSNILGLKDGAQPGVMIVDRNRDFNEQYEELYATQTRFAIALAEQADGFAANRNWSAITNLHRAMARWAGVPDRDWIKGIISPDKPESPVEKSCPSCGQTILLKALTCQHCSVFLPEFYLRAKLPLDRADDPVVYDTIQRLSPGEKLASPTPTPSTSLDSPTQVKLAPKPTPATK